MGLIPLKVLLTNCIDCEHHVVLDDPDETDWFNDDDVKVHCQLAKKDVMVGIRPYQVRKEAATPAWCPLKQPS